MHTTVFFLSLALGVTAALPPIDYLATFDELDFASDSVYDAQPVGPYDGFYWGNFKLFTAGENKTSAGGVEFASGSQAAVYKFPGQYDTTRILSPWGTPDFRDSFELHSFAFGCSGLRKDHTLSKPVPCSIRLEGYRTRDDGTGGLDLLATQTFQYKPVREGPQMKLVQAGAAFKNISVVLFNTSTKQRSTVETAVFLDDWSVTQYDTGLINE